jgi:hypothetical protein
MHLREADLVRHQIKFKDLATPQPKVYLAVFIVSLSLLVPTANAEMSNEPSGDRPNTSRIAVFRMEGKDIPASGLDVLSELVRQEIAQSEHLIVLDRTYSVDIGHARAAALETENITTALLIYAERLGANKAVTG